MKSKEDVTGVSRPMFASHMNSIQVSAKRIGPKKLTLVPAKIFFQRIHGYSLKESSCELGVKRPFSLDFSLELAIFYDDFIL